MDNIIAIYKPKGWTSHDVVDKVRQVTQQRRVGHAGTLDPLAEGVLVIGIGREATKQLNIHLQKEKEYEATIKLGETSTTGDSEGEKTTKEVQKIPTGDEVRQILQQFVGKINQTPPQYSAVKIGGKSAYKYARKGQEIKIEPREVLIKKIELTSYDYPFVTIKVTTGPGVYIRVLAEDIGRKLNTGGYLSKLVRIRVGEYGLKQAKSIEDFSKDYVAP